MADDITVVDNIIDTVNTAEAKRKLAEHLQSKFTQFKSDRQAIEQVWLQNLMQYLGRYDEPMKSAMAANTSRAYPKMTRVKVVSVVAKLMSLLFPASEKNWSIESSPVPNLPAEALVAALDTWYAANPPQQAQGQAGMAGAASTQPQPTQAQLDALVTSTAADVAERLRLAIDDQLQDVDPYGSRDYEALVKKVVSGAVKYGPGIVKGPMQVADVVSKFEIGESGIPQVVEIETFRPYLEVVPCWAYFPDLGAKEFAQMEGEFQRHVFSKHQFELMAARSDFDGDAIREFIKANRDGNYAELSYEGSMRTLAANGAVSLPKGTKYEVLEFWGTGSAKDLRDAGVEVDVQVGDEDQVRYTCWVVDKFIVKAVLNPFPEGTNIFHKFVFEDDEVSLLGSGLPPIMRDSQLAVASFARMLIDNASVVCGPSAEVDVSILDPNQADLSIRAFQVWRRDGGGPGQRAVVPITFPSHIPDLLSAMNTFKDFADKETFVSPSAGGDVEGVSGEALRTAGGASMIYGNAAMPFKDIVRNFDQFTVSIISALVQWNRLFSPDRDKLQGDVRPIARGSTSLMAKEMRSYALDNLATTLTEEERPWIKAKAMLTERLKVRDLPISDLMETDEAVEQKQAQAQQQSEQQMQQQMQMFAAQLEAMRADTMKALSQGQKNLDNADVAVFRAMVEALRNGSSPEQITSIAERAIGSRQGLAGQPAAVQPGGPVRGAPPVSIQ